MSGESLPEGYKQTKVGVIPEEWGVESIYNLSQRTNGVNPINNPDWTFKYVDVSCISQDTLKITNYLEYNGENAPSRARKLIKEGDILFSTIRPYLKQLAKVPATLDGEVCSTAFCIIRCDTKKVDPEYVFQSVTTDKFVSNVSSLQTGSNYPAVTDKDIFSQSIPLPPLPEQHRIAAVLSTVDAAIAATDEVIAKTEDLKRGLMQDLLTKGIDEEGRVRSEETHEFCEQRIGSQLVSLPRDWKLVNLSNLTQKITKGSTPTSYGFNYTDTGVNFIKIESIDENGHFKPNMFAHIDADTNMALKRSILKENDILFSIAGAIGRTAIVIDSILPANTNQALAIIRLKKDVLPYRHYIKYYLAGNFIQSKIKTIVSQSAQGNISLTQVRDFIIPIPPFTEQKRIMAVLSTVDGDLAAERTRRTHLQTLKKGLMQDLLTGRTRVPLNGGGPHGV